MEVRICDRCGVMLSDYSTSFKTVIVKQLPNDEDVYHLCKHCSADLYNFFYPLERFETNAQNEVKNLLKSLKGENVVEV